MTEAAPDPREIGRRFVAGLVDKDVDGLASLFSPNVQFRGLTPSDAWEATSPAEIASILLGDWFEDGDLIQEVLEVRCVDVADRARLRYRLRVQTEGTAYLVEQQGYFDAVDGRITRMSLMCAGFRPWPD